VTLAGQNGYEQQQLRAVIVFTTELRGDKTLRFQQTVINGGSMITVRNAERSIRIEEIRLDGYSRLGDIDRAAPRTQKHVIDERFRCVSAKTTAGKSAAIITRRPRVPREKQVADTAGVCRFRFIFSIFNF
jgi:hypothetical protein